MYKEDLGCSMLMWAYKVKLFHIFTFNSIFYALEIQISQSCLSNEKRMKSPLPEQHTRADPVVWGTGEPALRVLEQEG